MNETHGHRAWKQTKEGLQWEEYSMRAKKLWEQRKRKVREKQGKIKPIRKNEKQYGKNEFMKMYKRCMWGYG